MNLDASLQVLQGFLVKDSYPRERFFLLHPQLYLIPRGLEARQMNGPHCRPIARGGRDHRSPRHSRLLRHTDPGDQFHALRTCLLDVLGHPGNGQWFDSILDHDPTAHHHCGDCPDDRRRSRSDLHRTDGQASHRGRPRARYRLVSHGQTHRDQSGE